jgi:hypothetical protein
MPPKSPELNQVENIWQFMRDNWLSNRVFILLWTTEAIRMRSSANQLRAGWSLIGRFFLP